MQLSIVLQTTICSLIIIRVKTEYVDLNDEIDHFTNTSVSDEVAGEETSEETGEGIGEGIGEGTVEGTGEGIEENVTEDDSDTEFGLDDIFIAVQTSKNTQDSKLPLIVSTWFQQAKEQTWFFTDVFNPVHQVMTIGHVIMVNCNATNSLELGCCMTGAEVNHFRWIDKKWFCHFSENNYVNIPLLVEELAKLENHYRIKEWYIGHHPEELPLKIKHEALEKLKFYSDIAHSPFYYGGNGAGWCINRNVASKMSQYISGDRFVSTCKLLGQPDEVSLGYVIAGRERVSLTNVPRFHSNSEDLSKIPTRKLLEQITLSYKDDNVVRVPGFSRVMDPTRFLSLHCFIFPDTRYCKENRDRYTVAIRKSKKKKVKTGFLESIKKFLRLF